MFAVPSWFQSHTGLLISERISSAIKATNQFESNSAKILSATESEEVRVVSFFSLVFP